MLRRLITAFAALVLRIFFRQIEVIGLHRVPEKGAVLFVLNHPSGLIDPLFILTLAPRPVTFLAKSTLFSMPIVGWFTRGIEAIPVYRAQDPGSTAEKNRKTFERTRELLNQEKSIAIFPEGVSHSEARLKPLKSGAARIALGAELDRLWIVPAGLHYTSKGAFRSSVLLLFGEPFDISRDPGAGVDADGERSREAVQELTERIRQALSGLMLQAEHPETLALVERAEAIYSGVATLSLRERFERRRRFLGKYEELRKSSSPELAKLEDRLRRFDTELASLGLSPDDLAGRRFDPRAPIRLLMLLIALPLIIAGIFVHYPAYRLVGFLAKRLAKAEEDLVATIKVLSAMLFFPLSWIFAAAILGWLFGVRAAIVALLLAPISGYAALIAAEQIGHALAQLRELRYAWFRPGTLARLRAEGEAIHTQIRELA